MIRPRTALAVCAVAVIAFSTPLFAQQGGTVEGHVKLTGAAPPNARIPMGADPNCLTINSGKRVVQETVLRAADGSLANVFAFARGSFKGAPGAPAVIDQRACTYHPRIQGAQVGQTLEVRNSDATLHNIHSMTTKGNAFNTGQPSAGMVFKYKLKSEEVMLHVKCDVHPWMTGYIGVLNHPYYSVSDAAGNFRISGLPAGKQTITVWHEQYGPLSQVVDVKAGAVTKAEFAYTGAEKPAPSIAGLRIEELVLPSDATSVELVGPSPAR
jgi:plastocyanin